MKALSIRQPHAEAIMRGVKPIEFRSRPTNVRGRVYTVKVLVIVATPPVQTRQAEGVREQEVVQAVSTAVHADKTLDSKDVKLLDYKDCKWAMEAGRSCPSTE